MLGAIAGDVVGSVYEWNNIKSTDFPLFTAESRFTDDSVLSVALADAILNDRDYAEVMREYGRRHPNAGYGGRFRTWLQVPSMGPYNSFGNGSAMRTGPAGWAYATLEETLDRAKAFAAPTHDHPEGIRGAQVTAGAVYLGRHSASKEEIRAWIAEFSGYDLSKTCDEIRPAYSFDVTCQGSVPQAMTAFLESNDFEEAIRLAVSLGGDSDTIACISGSVAEPFYGGVPAGIARETRARLDDPMRGVVEAFETRFGPRKDSR